MVVSLSSPPPDGDASSRVGAQAAALARGLETAGRTAELTGLELVTIRSAQRLTVLAARGESLLVAADAKPQDAKELEKSALCWRTAPAAERPPVSEPEPAHRAPPAPAAAGVAEPKKGSPTSRAFALIRHAVSAGSFSQASVLLGNLRTALARAGDASELERRELEQTSTLLPQVLAALARIRAGDATAGVQALARLSADVGAPASIRWLALHWTARASLERGDVSAAGKAVRTAFELASQLDATDRALSACDLSEVLAANGRLDLALDYLGRFRRILERTGDASAMARSSMLEARIAIAQNRELDAIQCAERAHAVDPAAPEPPLFLATRALLARRYQDVEPSLAGVQHPEADRLRAMSELVAKGVVSHPTVAELLGLEQSTPSDEVLTRLHKLAKATPRLPQAAEVLAWKLFRVGHYSAARSIMHHLLKQELSAAQRASIQATLGAWGDQVGADQPRAGAPAAALAPLSAPPPPVPPATSPAASSVFSGDLRQFAIPELLEFLRSGRRTGTLVCSSTAGVGVLRLHGGNIVRASSPSAPSLVEDGLVVGEGARGALLAQFQRALTEMVTWTKGQFSFDPEDVAAAPPVAGVQLDPQVALLQIYKQLDEDGQRSGDGAAEPL